MFFTPQEYFKTVQDSFAALPKTPDELKETLGKVKKVVDIETTKAKDVVAIYNKAGRGDASINEIMRANKLAQDVVVASRFAVVMSMPGAYFALPALAKFADEFDFDFVPESVKEEFDI